MARSTLSADVQPTEESSAPELVIRPQFGFIPVNFAELWRYRELFFFLAWRDILIRYKQTAIGILWAVIQPVLTMLVFTIIFSRIAKLPSHNAPYAVMVFAALLPWQFFATAVMQSSQSVVISANMIQKIYFPRLVIPVSATLVGAADFLVSMVILLGLMLWYGVPFSARLLLLPVFTLGVGGAALGVGLWLSALNVTYRDIKHAAPFFVRLGMYVSPVGFVSSVIPEPYRLWYNLNPMAGLIDAFRWCILGDAFTPYWPGFMLGVGILFTLLISGAFFFRRMERHFADVI